MTAVGAFKVDGCPLVIGDLLMTGETKIPVEFGLPAVGDVREYFGPGWSILELRQKISIINERCVIAWCGTHYLARSIIKELHRISTKTPLSADGVRAFLSSHDAVAHDKVGFVGWVFEEDPSRFVQFHVKARTHRSESLGRIYYAGTGEHIFPEFADLHKNMEVAETGQANAVARAMGIGLSMSSLLFRAELHGAHSAPTLLHMFGGGYEVAFFAEGRFRKISDVTFMVWGAMVNPDQISLQPQLIIRTTYRKNVLLLRSARFAAEDGPVFTVVDQQGHVALPMLPDYEWPSRDELIALSFNTSLFAHCFHIHNEGQDPAYYTMVQHVSEQSPPVIEIEDLADVLKLGLSARFISEVVSGLRRCLNISG